MLNPTLETKKWIAEFVIQHHLCPFARQPFEAENIYYAEEQSLKTEQILISFHKTINVLVKESYSNAFLILESMKFEDYLEVFYKSEMYLESIDLDSDFQLASFHPKYQFDGYEKEDKRNKTNQSIFPMIHVLRVAEMEDAIASYGDTSKVFLENEKKMRDLG